MAGDDALITEYYDYDCAQVMGIAGNSLDDLRIDAAAGFLESTNGLVYWHLPPIRAPWERKVDPLCSTDAGLRCSRRLHK